MEQPLTPAERRAEQRTSIVWGAALVTVILLVLSGIAWLFWVGLFQLPGSSWSAASVPLPRRTVAPIARVTVANVGERLRSRLQASVLRGDTPYRVRLSEAEVTTLVAALAKEEVRSPLMVPHGTQVAVSEGEVELFSRFTVGIVHADIRLRAAPEISKGVLNLNIREARLGRATIPPSLLSPILSFLLQQDPRSLRLAFGAVTVVGVQAHAGALDLSFR